MSKTRVLRQLWMFVAIGFVACPNAEAQTQPGGEQPRPARADDRHLSSAWEFHWDWARSIESNSKGSAIVGRESDIVRTPVFDNAPFLRLKPNARLLKGGYWNRGGKGQKPSLAKENSHFLRVKKQYSDHFYALENANLWARSEGERLLLRGPEASVLFDWDLNLNRAAQLFALNQERERQITPQQYQKLKTVLRQKFPECRIVESEPFLLAPRIVSEPAQPFAIFEELRFDSIINSVVHSRHEIGPGVFREYRKTLLIGPPRVEKWEFEDSGFRGPNSAPPLNLDPQTAARLRAEYKRMSEFRDTIEPFLTPAKTFRAQSR